MSYALYVVDLERGTLTVRQGKGKKDRVTVLAESLHAKLEEQKASARQLFDADRAAAAPGVALPTALERKWPRAGETWPWFWLLPAPKESIDPATGVKRRHHVHEAAYNRAIQHV